MTSLSDRHDLIITEYKNFFKGKIIKKIKKKQIDTHINDLDTLKKEDKEILKYFIKLYLCFRNIEENHACPILPTNIDNTLYNSLMENFDSNLGFHTPNSRPVSAMGGFYKQRVIKVIRKY